MASYFLEIADGATADLTIEAANDHEALNTALNALSQFACKRFPPTEKISIKIADEARTHVATLKFEFSIEYGEGMLH